MSNGAIALVPAGRSTERAARQRPELERLAAVEGHPQPPEAVRLAQARRLLGERAQQAGPQVPGGGRAWPPRGARRASTTRGGTTTSTAVAPGWFGDLIVTGSTATGSVPSSRMSRSGAAGPVVNRTGADPSAGNHSTRVATVYVPPSDQARAARRRARRVSRSTSPGWTP